jgi:hypothetical protein
MDPTADILNEQPITLTVAAREIPGRPHASTCWRWRKIGCRGIKLETVTIGGRVFTSREAVRRFIAATTNRDKQDGIRPERAVSRRRQAAIQKAEKELAEAGI